MANRNQPGPLSQYANAKNYLESNKIPQMFESLIASLMMERPENHFSYLDKQLNVIKEKGLENVNWETFIRDLHPLRDETRLNLVQDDVSAKIKAENCQKTATPKQDGNNDYEPEVFQLTETQDE